MVSVEEIDEACREVLTRQQARGRLYASARLARVGADGRLGAEDEDPPRHRRPGPGAPISARRRSRKGLRLDISPWRRPAPYTAPTESKASGLYMICTLARHAAQAKGYDDALMFDWRGQVAEATGANAFFVRDGALHTPTPDCFLDGITRRTVIDLARRRGIEVIERAIWPEELEELRAILPDRQRRRGDPGRLGRPVELRGRRADPAAAQGLSRPRQPPDFEQLSCASPVGRRGRLRIPLRPL